MTIRYVNGRVLLEDAGGMRRYVAEVADNLPNVVVVKPRAEKQRWSGRVWEQTTLLRRTIDGVLLNMAHSGPARHPLQVNVIHDLFALRRPSSVHPARAALMGVQIPRLVRNAKRLVTVSSAMASELSDEFSIPLRSIAVVPPGISDTFRPVDKSMARRQLEVALDRPVVGALLDPAPRKRGVATVEVLRAIQVEVPDAQIVVAGPTRRPSQPSARRSLPPSRTGFVDLGNPPDATLAALYQSADVFVSMGDTEGFGLPVVEAARSGAAVVSAPVPSIIEHCAAAVDLVGSVAEATSAAVALLNDPGRRADMAETAAEALAGLLWSRTAADLDEIMTSVIGT